MLRQSCAHSINGGDQTTGLFLLLPIKPSIPRHSSFICQAFWTSRQVAFMNLIISRRYSCMSPHHHHPHPPVFYPYSFLGSGLETLITAEGTGLQNMETTLALARLEAPSVCVNMPGNWHWNAAFLLLTKKPELSSGPHEATPKQTLWDAGHDL